MEHVEMKTGANMEKEEGKTDGTQEKLPIRFIPPGEMKTSMKDIGGYEEAKLEVIEYVNFINHEDRYKKLGARLPKGALLVGPPGTGKTLLARATAGEANVPFIACSAASLLIGHDGANKSREIFKFALAKTPCVLFFDEIDCIGLARSDTKRSTQESRALTEELLVQLDGFQQTGDKLLVVLASTNHKQDLDEALTRPGRFDRVIAMPTPDLETRLAIMQVHLAPLTIQLDKEYIAKRFAILTAGLTGAEIATMCNEAAMIAGRDLNEHIGMNHFESALDRVRSGIKKRKAMSKEERLTAAYHDAAHAVAGWFLDGASPPTKLGILPNAAGSVECSQEKLCGLGRLNKDHAKNTIAVVLAGAAAEELKSGQHGAHCDSDFLIATKLAWKMVSESGMSTEVGKANVKSIYTRWDRWCTDLYRLGSDTYGKVFERVRSILDECFDIAKNVLKEHEEQLEKVAQLLMEKDLLTLDMLVGILGSSPHLDMDKLKMDDANFLPAGMKDWNTKKDDMW